MRQEHTGPMEGKIRIAGGTVGESIVDGPASAIRRSCRLSARLSGLPQPADARLEGGQIHEPDTLPKDMCRNPFIKGVTFGMVSRSVRQSRCIISRWS